MPLPAGFPSGASHRAHNTQRVKYGQLNLSTLASAAQRVKRTRARGKVLVPEFFACSFRFYPVTHSQPLVLLRLSFGARRAAVSAVEGGRAEDPFRGLRAGPARSSSLHFRRNPATAGRGEPRVPPLTTPQRSYPFGGGVAAQPLPGAPEGPCARCSHSK